MLPNSGHAYLTLYVCTVVTSDLAAFNLVSQHTSKHYSYYFPQLVSLLYRSTPAMWLLSLTTCACIGACSAKRDGHLVLLLVPSAQQHADGELPIARKAKSRPSAIVTLTMSYLLDIPEHYTLCHYILFWVCLRSSCSTYHSHTVIQVKILSCRAFHHLGYAYL